MSSGRQSWHSRGTAIVLWFGLSFSLGRVIVVNHQADLPDLAVGLLPPQWVLVLALVLGIAATLWHFTPHRSLLILPAALLALPWLAPSSPLLFSQPATLRNFLPVSVFLWLWPVAPLVWAAMLVGWLADLRLVRRVPRFLDHPVRAPLFAISCAAALFIFAACRLAPWLPDGDEPHYLVIAQSLLRDGDLQIENNHREGQYREYTTRELKPDYLQRGTNGQIYSIHAPGLPALVLPAFAIAGYRGVTIVLALIAALGTGLAWRVCWLVTGRASAAWIGWAAVTGSSPFLFHAFTIFPDGVASVIVLTGVLALVRAPQMSVTRAVLHGVALALLPWLHTRYAILAATLGLLVVWRVWLTRNAARTRLVASFLALPACSAIAWFAFFYAIYGTIDPTAPYGSATQRAWALLPNGVTGLLIDQQFGLVTNAPIYAIALGGLIWMLWRRQRLAWDIVLIAVPYTIATAAYPMWWGGWSAPARFLVPLVLMLGVPVAVVWNHARTLTAKATVGVALGITVWLTVLMLSIHRGRIAYNDRDGYALWADWAGQVVDLTRGLPSLFRGDWLQAWGCAAVWAIAIAGAWWLLRQIECRRVDSDDTAAPMFMTAIAPAVFGVAAMIALAVNGAGLRVAHGASPFRPPAPPGMQAYGAARVAALDDGIFLEPGGFWIEPGADRRLLIVVPSASASASAAESAPLRIALRNGALPNRATVAVPGLRFRREVSLRPKEEVAIEVPAPAAWRRGRMVLTLSVERGVRAADFDPPSGDRRLLGLWVELRGPR
jgi:hypothetical protein